MTPSLESTTPAEPTAGHGEGEVFDPADHPPTRRGLFAVGAVAALVAAGLIAAGVVPRVRHRAVVEKEEKAAAAVVPQVQVARVVRAPAGLPVVLPGTVQALQETAMYARASGYVRKWYVDIGAEVKKGQVLADLDLPEIDQELRQAQASANQAAASVSQAKSHLDLARTTSQRYTALAGRGVVSQQQTDEYTSEYAVRQADLEAANAAAGNADANVRRIAELRGFGTITAPFDGVVTLRTAEVGQLVVPGTGQGQPLFKVAEDDSVRVFVNVPQLYAAGVKRGADAPVSVREVADRVFHGTVARTSRELDTATRALLVEIDVPNPDRALLPGMYAKVSLDVSRQDTPLLVPATAALIDASGTRVAVVREGVLHWQNVEIGSDLGDRLAIATGLSEGDSVVVSPSDRLAEGLHVQPETGAL